MTPSSPYRPAAVFVLIGAVLQMFAFTVGGLSTAALTVIPCGVSYLLIAAGLNRNKRWLAWLTFFVTGIAGSTALAMSFGGSAMPAWWCLALMSANWIATLLLFSALWRPAPDTAELP